MKRRLVLGFLVLAMGLSTVAWAQWRRGWSFRSSYYDTIRTAREVESHSTGTPTWENPPEFAHDVFAFARLRYSNNGGGRGGWTTDLPDSDLNLSWRLQQMTSMKVDPDGRILNITDEDLAGYPFVYIVEPGGLSFSDDEAAALRRYLLNGGFLLLDDFWGEYEWENCEWAMKQVFPDRSFVELPLEHPLYKIVFDIKEKGQVPNVQTGIESEYTGITWERPDAAEVHHRAIFDDQGRIMVLALHNTDNGDGWEREGESDYYFHNFSEKIAYPLAVNIIVYIMTH